MKLKKLEVILKITERCNINCDYCYFFNGKDESFKIHPKCISSKVLGDVVLFLKQGCIDYGVKLLQIDIHGGEPLLQKKEQFGSMCALFYDSLADVTKVSISIQTNATLIDDEWIRLFERYRIQVGVSLDGPQFLNDQHRVDHKGNGTYHRILKGLTLLSQAALLNRIAPPGVLCVINPEYDSKMIYDHFTSDLKLQYLDFLFPDLTHDSLKDSSEPYGQFLCDIFDIWSANDDPNIKIRTFEACIMAMLGSSPMVSGFGKAAPKDEYVALTIASNGDLAPEDSYRSINPEYMQLGANVASTTLKDFLSHPILIFLDEELRKLPTGCQTCGWKNVCGGGSLVHRYNGETNSFDNRSVMCDGLKKLYKKVLDYLSKIQSHGHKP